MRFKLVEDSLNEVRGEKNLREALIEIARLFNWFNVPSEKKWVLHHLNGDHSDNSIANFALMESSAHKSYHGKIRSLNIKLDSAEAVDYLKNNYPNTYVFIGEKLLSEINRLSKIDENSVKSDDTAV